MCGMEALEPIKSIKVNFGSPTLFTPPRTESVCDRIIEEAKDCEENPHRPYMVDEEIWEAAATEEERKRRDELQKALDDAEEEYDPKRDAPDSQKSKTHIAAYDALERFKDETGKHICFRCSHYYDPEGETAHVEIDKDMEKTVSKMRSACDIKRCWVRPLGRACSGYTTDTTAIMQAAEQAYKDAMRRHPNISHRISSNLRERNAYKFVSSMMASPATAFYIYDTNTEYYDSLYREFPNLFLKSKFPTIEELKTAYERWKQTTTVVKRGNHITITLRDKEFAPKDEAESAEHESK